MATTKTYGWGSTSDPSKMTQMYQDYFTDPAKQSAWGEKSTIDFASGKLTKNADNSATFVDAGGKSYTFNGSTPFEEVAANAPQIGAHWKTQYGWNPDIKAPDAPTAVQASSASAGAGNWAVTDDQLVEKRLKGLLSDNNPLVQMAKTQGLENAQQRGLLNSSLGAEAGTLAHYQYAMPVAQADATMFGNAARTNAENATQAAIANAQMQTQTNLANANAQNNMSQLQFSAANNMAQAQYNAQVRMAELDKQNANAFAQLDKQQSYAIRNSYLSSMTSANSQMQSFINSVQAADMPDDAKTAQINAAQESFNNTIRYMDAAYSRMPGWYKEWSLLPATIG